MTDRSYPRQVKTDRAESLAALFIIICACLSALAASPCSASAFDNAVSNGQFGDAVEMLAQMPPGSADTGTDVDSILTVLPLLQWNNDTSEYWSATMTIVERETNAYWAANNIGAMLGALASPDVPHNAQTDSLIDRAVAAAQRWPGQGGPLLAAKGVLWYGDFDKAFAEFPNGACPEELTEFAFETLADKPGLAAQDALWTVAESHIAGDPTLTTKAVRALAFAGRTDDALALAGQESASTKRTEDLISAARYSRYGGHDAYFAPAMIMAAKEMQELEPAPEVLPILRDLMAETKAVPIAPLPDSFWQSNEAWAEGLPPELSPAAIAEIVGASAWAGRDDAVVLLPKLAGTSWDDPARVRVACGWLWTGRRADADEVVSSIKDASWKALAAQEMDYLSRQQNGIHAPAAQTDSSTFAAP